MKQTNSCAVALLVVLAAQLAPVAANAQDSLRVLRIQPSSQASPIEPLVITFDHPVAPNLDQSIEAERVLHITPAVGAHIYWRDPSTIVADFDSAWTAGASYDVRIDPRLRSAAGLSFASPQTFVVKVRLPRMLGIFPAANESEADTIAHPIAVFESSFDLATIAGRVWFVPRLNCRTTDSVALNAVRLRRISDSVDSWSVREAGGYGRDHRLDSLRRVVEFDLPATLARGCQAELRLPAVVGQPAVQRAQFVVRAAFLLLRSLCPVEEFPLKVDDSGRQRCNRGRITLRFTNPVRLSEIRAHVLVNGQPASIPNESPDEASNAVSLLDSIQPRITTRVTVQSTLRSLRGEPLGRDTTFVIVGNPIPPSVGYATGQVVVPRDAPILLRVRHVNTDSMIIVIGRVPDSLRSTALTHVDSPYERRRWESIVRDSVVHAMKTIAPADSERVVEVATSWIPRAWRDDPMLLVRVIPSGGTNWMVGEVDAKPDRTKRERPAIVVHAVSFDIATPRFAVVRRSNIAAQVLGTVGDVEVWVTSLRTAQPRAGAIVRLLDDSMHAYASAVTDARGRARLGVAVPRNVNLPLHIEAAEGTDRALLLLSPQSPVRNAIVDEDSLNGQWWFRPTTKMDGRWLHGTAFTERGIYRPGERVYLGGAVRTFSADSGYRTPGSDSARWTIWYANADGGSERVWSHVGRLSDFGTLADSFALSRTVRLGEYAATLALRAQGGWRTAARVAFHVAEYRAPEFALRLDVDSVTPLFGGDTARVRIDARYLFGLPMAGGAVHWWWSERERDWWGRRVPGLERYTVGRAPWRYSEESHGRELPTSEGEAVLAADGTFTLRMPTRSIVRPGDVQVNVTVTDANRQAVTSQLTLPLHAANAYVGMRTRERRWVWRARDTVAVEMLVVRPDGTTRVGDVITVVAQRNRWIKNKVVRDTVWQTTLTSAAEPVTVRFLPRAGGSYELLASVTDEQGRRALTGFDVWVAGGNNTWAQRDPRAITLRSDQTSYAPGDNVSLIVDSPGEQRAWVSLRREGLLHEQFVDLHTGVNEVRIPVPATAAPNAEIRVIAVRPYGSRGDDSAGIYYRTGSISIPVDTAARSLHVTVAPERTRYRPGDSVRVNLNVRDASGKPRRAEATVWAVDQGVVSLTDFRRPALLSMLMAGSGDYAWVSSTLIAWMLSTPPAVGPAYFFNFRYGSLPANSAMSMMRVAGGSAMASPAVLTGDDATGETVRRAFATTPFFTGSVRTDSSGRATVAFKLPDNVTTFRLYAAAVGDDIYAGSGDTSIITTRPLIVRAALPRIVRVGDTLFAGAVITQEATSRTPVSLSIATTNVAVSGSATLYDTLDAQRSREVRFPMSVTGGDSVTFVFRGTATGTSPASDAVEARLAISPPGRARAHVVTGMIDRTGEASLAVPEGTDTLRSRVELQLGVSALPLVRQYSEALRIYPYYCTEQVSSAGRALLARLALQRALGDSAPLTARDRAQLETGVSTVLARQRADGGYGYWSAIHWTDAWLTAYALDFLLGARDVGIAVPASSLERAKNFLASTFPLKLRTGGDPWRAWRDTVAWPHYAVAAASMLRRVGAADTTLERDLWGFRRELGFEDRLTLAALYAARSDTAKSNELVNDAWRSAHIEGRRVTLDDSAASRTWIFRSTSRPIALLSPQQRVFNRRTRCSARCSNRWCKRARARRSRWWNTLDQAAVAEALTAAGRAMQLSTTRTIAVSGPRGAIATVVVEPARAESLHVSMASLSVREKNASSLRLGLSSTSSARTYFAMTLFEIPLARPVRADAAGIGVERWYESYDGGKPITEVREGELVRVRLRITAPADREFVVIDDALPAGLEAVDLSLRTSASLPPFPGAPRLRADMNEGPPGQRWMYGSWDSGWWTPWEHKEIRDDRVLYFARQLWKGSYQASYVARATTAGVFVRPPAQAEEMYNPAVHGRSDGGVFTVTRAPR